MGKNDKSISKKMFLAFIVLCFLIGPLTLLNIKKVDGVEAYYISWTSTIKAGVKLVAMSPEGNYIAMVSEDQKIYFFDNKGNLLWNYFQSGFAPTSLAISENASNIIAGFSSTGAYEIISKGKVCSLTKEGTCKWSMDTNSVSSVAIAPYGEAYIGLTFENGLGWSDDLFFFGGGNKWQKGLGAIPSEKTGACSVATSGKYVAAIAGAGTGRGKILEYFNIKGELLWQYKIPTATLLDGRCFISITGDGQYLVTGNEDSTEVYFFNKGGTLLWQYTTEIKISAVSISTEGKYVAACSKDGTIYLLNNAGALLWSSSAFVNANSVALSTNGNTLVIGDSNKISVFAKLQPVALAAIGVANSKILEAKAKGILVTEAEKSYKVARDACAAGDYEQAKTRAEATSTEVATIMSLYENSKSLMLNVKTLLTEGEKKNLNLAAVKTLLEKAQTTFKKGAYAEAQTFAEDAVATATQTIQTETLAKTALSKAASVIAKEKTKNYNMTKPTAIYQAALKLYASSDYSGALKLAEESSAKAGDLDGDGLANEKDFAPYFNNKSLYEILGGTFLLFLLSLGLTRKKRLYNLKYQEELLNMKETISKLKRAGYTGKDLNDFTGRYF